MTGDPSVYVNAAVLRSAAIHRVLFNAARAQWFDYYLDVSAQSTEV